MKMMILNLLCHLFHFKRVSKETVPNDTKQGVTP